jgi:hypothetical protein
MWIAGGGKLPVLDETSFMRPGGSSGGLAGQATQPNLLNQLGLGEQALEEARKAKKGRRSESRKNPLCLPPQPGKQNLCALPIG